MIINGVSNIGRKSNGFTLLEMMIVTAIIGILAAIALPVYNGYRERTNRADTMAEIQQIASRIEAAKISYKRYSLIPLNEVATPGATLASGQYNYPTRGTPLYTVSFWNTSANSATQATGTTLETRQWEIRAVPITTGMMSQDGTLTIDSSGQKCRDTTCGTGEEWRD